MKRQDGNRAPWVLAMVGILIGSCARVRGQGPSSDASPDGSSGLPETHPLPAADANPVPGPDAMIPLGKSCKVPPETLDAKLMACTKRAPPMAFEPKLKWSWSEPETPGATASGSMVIPLVGNLTDDNGDGAIDLCDVPDVVLTTETSATLGEIYVLAGDTGKLEFKLEGKILPWFTPALGDMDGDGVPEIVTLTKDPTLGLSIYDNKGKLKIRGEVPHFLELSGDSAPCGAISIYDLDADGNPEIIVGGTDVFDNKGKHLFGHDSGQNSPERLFDIFCMTNAAADLDGDGKLEVILGNAVFHADGRMAFPLPGPPGHPHIANFDADPEPEILLARRDGLWVLEADGTVKFGPVAPEVMPSPTPQVCWAKPAAVHDLDGDGKADIAFSSCGVYGIFKVSATGLSLNWKYPIGDSSGIAASTAFDFLGRGVAQAVYGDQVALYVFDGKSGMVDLKRDRSSGTLIEFPVVADIDADDSADILVVSNNVNDSAQHFPTLQVFEDAQKRWIPARRIWNQHSYHVTNVREDGTIPRVMPKHWLRNNTFRTNAQIDGVQVCTPDPIP